MKGISPSIGQDVLQFVDVLIRFWCQNAKGQGHSRRRYNRRQQPVELHLVYKRKMSLWLKTI